MRVPFKFFTHFSKPYFREFVTHTKGVLRFVCLFALQEKMGRNSRKGSAPARLREGKQFEPRLCSSGARSPQATNIWSRATEKGKAVARPGAKISACAKTRNKTSKRIEMERNETKRNSIVLPGSR